MKVLKFLFVAVLLTCIVGVTQTNAQVPEVDKALIEVEYDVPWSVMYEVDGVMVYAVAIGDIHIVYTPGGTATFTFQGQLPEGTLLPKSAVKYDWNLGTVLITPSGEVTISQKMKKVKV